MSGAIALGRSGLSASQGWLQVLFFLSGAAALAYQVCWQRVLFFSLGTDVESVTVVVSTFMLGLGLGALAGGWLADRFSSRIVVLFAAAEAGIGGFGLISPALLTGVADSLVQSSRAVTAAASFGLLLFPTCLMGATLPMLIAHFLRHYGSVGVSTGQLYFVNTLGAAIGALSVGLYGFSFLTLREVIYCAAAVNLIVAAVAFLRLRQQ